MPLLGGFLLAVGVLGVVTFALLPAVEAIGCRTWEPAEAIVDEFRVDDAGLLLPVPIRRISLTYHYKWTGDDHQGDRFGPHGGLIGGLPEEPIEPGDEIVVWVNPANPSQALVSRDFQWPLFAIGLVSLSAALVGGFAVFLGMVMMNDRRLMLGRRRPR